MYAANQLKVGLQNALKYYFFLEHVNGVHMKQENNITSGLPHV